MSDRHLCKAKRTDNGEWVEGYYFCMLHTDGRHAHHFIIPLGADLSKGRAINKIQVEVNPSTICQYIGLKDKNGKRWQGDIFEAYNGEFIQRYVIEWNEEELQWYAECVTSSDYPLPLCEFRVEEIDVIGNAIDNPELLKGGAK